jgi:tRNA threonylcarbamoyladenosine dehydratase
LDYISAKNRDKLYDGALAYLQGSEEKLVRTKHSYEPGVGLGLKVPLTTGEVAFLMDDLWKGRSAITGISTRLVLIRWRRPATDTLLIIGEGKNVQRSAVVKLRDLVCMTKDEAVRHEKTIFKEEGRLQDLYDADTIQRVEERLNEAAKYERFRG